MLLKKILISIILFYFSYAHGSEINVPVHVHILNINSPQFKTEVQPYDVESDLMKSNLVWKQAAINLKIIKIDQVNIKENVQIFNECDLNYSIFYKKFLDPKAMNIFYLPSLKSNQVCKKYVLGLTFRGKERFIILRQNINFKTSSSYNDLRYRVLAHESGHFFNLEHDRIKDNLMYPQETSLYENVYFGSAMITPDTAKKARKFLEKYYSALFSQPFKE